MNVLAQRLVRRFNPALTKFSSSEASRIDEAFKSRSSTIDEKDVENLSQYSENWWDTTGQMRGLHAFNPLRIKLIKDGLLNTGYQETSPSKPLEGLNILDVGCGGGILSEPLARIGGNVTGIDASKELISIAQDHLKFDKSIASNINYVHTTIEDWKDQNKDKYDAVVASEILEHVIDHELFLKSCVEVLKPNGSLFITTINKTPPAFGGIIASEYILRIVPMGTHDWNKFISPEDTRRLLDKYDCKTRLIHGVCYNPITNNWSWTTTTVMNYALHAVKLVEK